MKIGIIGAGNIGGTVAELFIDAGHEIAIANSRGAETLRDLVNDLDGKAQASEIEDAAKFGEVVLVAIPFGEYETLPAEAFRGKIVIDANNYYPQRDGQFPELDDDSTTSSEMLEKHLKGASVVKAFNTIESGDLQTQGDTNLPLEKRRVIFIAGDDSKAKETVAGLIEEIGFAAVDNGFLSDGGRRQQPGTPVYGQTLTIEEAAIIYRKQD